MQTEFKLATKSQSKLRCALFGPSGSGKTYSALRIATGMGGKIALIDTERGSASLYADRFKFDVMNLDDRSIDGYIGAMEAAAKAGYDVLIIDSLTHAWRELLGELDKLTYGKFGGNSWAAWSVGTPRQQKFVNALLGFPGHVMATMRSKTEWKSSTDQNSGKTIPVRIGLTPEQGKGIEFEFTLLLELSTEHFANVIKDRTGKFQDELMEKPGEDFGKQMIAWLAEGATAVPEEAKPAIDVAMDELDKQLGVAPDQTELIELCTKHNLTEVQKEGWRKFFNVATLSELSQDNVNAICSRIKSEVERKLQENK